MTNDDRVKCLRDIARVMDFWGVSMYAHHSEELCVMDGGGRCIFHTGDRSFQASDLYERADRCTNTEQS